MIMNKRSLIALDLDLNFTPHPTNKDIVVQVDENAIKRAVRNLMLLKRNEKPFHPEISSGVTDMLFENPDPIVFATLKNDITRFIQTYEPRATRINVNVARISNDELSVTMVFFVQNRQITVNTPIQVYRTR